jgi:hypothetical protein
MKAPNLKDLNKVEKQDAFSQVVETVQAKQEEMIKKTFTLDQRTVDVINDLALQLGQERGKVVSASEAVRVMASQFKGV